MLCPYWISEGAKSLHSMTTPLKTELSGAIFTSDSTIKNLLLWYKQNWISARFLEVLNQPLLGGKKIKQKIINC